MELDNNRKDTDKLRQDIDKKRQESQSLTSAKSNQTQGIHLFNISITNYLIIYLTIYLSSGERI